MQAWNLEFRVRSARLRQKDSRCAGSLLHGLGVRVENLGSLLLGLSAMGANFSCSDSWSGLGYAISHQDLSLGFSGILEVFPFRTGSRLVLDGTSAETGGRSWASCLAGRPRPPTLKPYIHVP